MPSGNTNVLRGLKLLVLSPDNLLSSLAGSATNGITKNRAMRVLPSQFGPCATSNVFSWWRTCG